MDVEANRDKFLKEYGKGVFAGLSNILEEKRDIIKISPQIDIILGGGVLEGSMMIVTGPPKVGKSCLALTLAKSVQQTPCEYGNRKIFYFDIEGRIKQRDIKGIQGLNLDTDRFELIRSTQERILTGEDFLTIGEQFIKDYPQCMFIFDSFSSICTSEEYSSDMDKRFRANAPLLIATFCRRIAQVISVNKSIVYGITHIIANQGFGHKTTMEASGNKLKYQTDIKLHLKFAQPWTVGTGDNTKQIGQKIKIHCDTNALGCPGRECESYFRYGYGIDDNIDYINLGIDLGLIQNKGSWYTIGEEKIQGSDKAAQYISQCQDIKDEIDKQVKEIYSFV